MIRFLQIFCALALACCVSACGYKGRLKSPDQIEKIEAKKVQKQQEKDSRAQPPAPVPSSAPQPDMSPATVAQPVVQQPAVVAQPEPQPVAPPPVAPVTSTPQPAAAVSPVPPANVPAPAAPVSMPAQPPLSTSGNDVVIDTTPANAVTPEQK